MIYEGPKKFVLKKQMAIFFKMVLTYDKKSKVKIKY